MKAPYWHIWQEQTNPDTGEKSTIEIANISTENLAIHTLQLLQEDAECDPNVEFKMFAYDEHESVTDHWIRLGEWASRIMEYPQRIGNDMELGAEIRKTYLEIFGNDK
jgi:hypothetical protein